MATTRQLRFMVNWFVYEVLLLFQQVEWVGSAALRTVNKFYIKSISTQWSVMQSFICVHVKNFRNYIHKTLRERTGNIF